MKIKELKISKLNQIKTESEAQTETRYRLTLKNNTQRITIEQDTPFDGFYAGQKLEIEVINPQTSLKGSFKKPTKSE